MTNSQIAKTVACWDGDHARCKCELPGQNPLAAGLMIERDESSGEFNIVGKCECECHAGIKIAFDIQQLPLSVEVLSRKEVKQWVNG